MALHKIIEYVSNEDLWLDENEDERLPVYEQDKDFETLNDLAFEDHDVLMLFQPRYAKFLLGQVRSNLTNILSSCPSLSTGICCAGGRKHGRCRFTSFPVVRCLEIACDGSCAPQTTGSAAHNRHSEGLTEGGETGGPGGYRQRRADAPPPPQHEFRRTHGGTAAQAARHRIACCFGEEGRGVSPAACPTR